MQQRDGIVQCVGGDDLREADAALDQLHDLAAGGGRQLQAARIAGGCGAIARQGNPQRFHQRVHGRGRAHDHTMPGAAYEILFHRFVGLGTDGSGQVFGAVTAAIGASAEDFASVMPIEHGTAADHDCRQVGAGGAHQRGRRRFVAIRKQDDAAERVAADHLFGVHGREVATEHGCRAEVNLAQRDGGEFQREAAGLQHTAFDRFTDFPQVAVAVVELAVRIADADERSVHVGAVVAHGGGEGAPDQAGDALGVEEVLAAFGSHQYRLYSFSS